MSKGYRAPSNPLAGIKVSRRLAAELLEGPREPSPMLPAVKLRARLMDLGFRVILQSPSYMQIASPERPNRFQGYHIDSAQRLLEKCHE